MAATAEGVCALSFGERGAESLPETGAAPAAHPTMLDAWIDAVHAHIDDGTALPSLPLHLQGTAFQQTVWQALRDIPAGQTRSYSAIAAAVGAPRAMRAVGSACAANRVAVLVPCHRVLRGDGGLGGFRWGAAIKQALLAAEGQADRHGAYT